MILLPPMYVCPPHDAVQMTWNTDVYSMATPTKGVTIASTEQRIRHNALTFDIYIYIRLHVDKH